MQLRFSKLSSEGKFKRTLFSGVPLLLIIFYMASNYAESVLQKYIIPTVIVILFIVQLLYYYKQYTSNR